MDELLDQPTPLEFLTAVYCNENLPLSVRMRAAIECAQYRHAKLGVVATTNMNADDFASMLDRAIQRSGMKVIEHRQDESLKPSPAPLPPHGTPRQGPTPDRRFRRA
jgi:hypothetical protein